MDDDTVRVSEHEAGDHIVRRVTLTHKLTYLLMKKSLILTG